MIGDSRGGVLGAPYLGFLRSMLALDWRLGLLRQDSRGGLVGVVREVQIHDANRNTENNCSVYKWTTEGDLLTKTSVKIQF
jgi:hypothetical protein